MTDGKPINEGDEFEVSGKVYTVVGDAKPDGQPGLWWVCERDDPGAKLILRDEDFIRRGTCKSTP